MTINHTDIEQGKRGYRAVVRVVIRNRPRTIRARFWWSSWTDARTDAALIVASIAQGNDVWRGLGVRR